MNTKLIHRLSAVLCLIGVLFWFMAGMLHAAADEVSGTLTMICQTTEGIKLEGMHWDVFKIGGRDADGNYELQGAFAKYPVSLEDTSASALAFTAETLDTFASVDKLIPFASLDADENGYLKFTDLGVGLYLVAGDYVQIEDTYYFPAAFILEIMEGGTAQDYDMSVYPKYIYKNGNQKEEYTVKKVWENDALHLEDRSAYVTVEIYRDEVLYETVRLDESNDWTYSWTAEKPYDWRVHEIDIPKNYYVLYRSNETQYVVENTYNDDSSIVETQVTSETDSQMTETSQATDHQVTDTTAATDATATDSTTETAASNAETTSATSAQSNDTAATTTKTSTTTTTTTTSTTPSNTDKLPQTGQLWWPVPVLGLAGLVLIVIGFQMRTKE